ncbi:hypothetical protein RCL1_000030 [Eukaryota sp. TZLM3-RCL]
MCSFHLKVLENESVEFSSGNPKVFVSTGRINLFADKSHQNSTNGQLVCLLGIPLSFQVPELCVFLENELKSIKHIRVLTSSHDRYLALLRFTSSSEAKSFVDNYHGNSFPTLDGFEPIRCFLVASVEIYTDNEQYKNSFFMDDSFYELPTCCFCLERLDPQAGTSLISIFCDHAYHVSCFSNWGDSKCAVCRYCVSAENQKCLRCGQSSDLWSCLVCGYIGCGRQSNGCALNHYKETGHAFSIDLSTQRVWSYSEDSYVHRLLTDLEGKLVSVDMPKESSSKVETVVQEYSTLLEEQIEQQRIFYESQIISLQEQLENFKIQGQRLVEQVAEVSTKSEEYEKEIQRLQQKSTDLQTEVATQKKKASTLEKLNRSLLEREQKKCCTYEEQIKQLKETVVQLQSDNADLMAHLDLSSQISSRSDSQEIGSGAMLITRKSSNRGRSRR